MAAKEGLELAVENGYDRVILEVDCRGLQTLLEDASKFCDSFWKKNSVPTELDEFRENSDEFRTQFGEISECKA
jgi:hypothetical protein